MTSQILWMGLWLMYGNGVHFDCVSYYAHQYSGACSTIFLHWNVDEIIHKNSVCFNNILITKTRSVLNENLYKYGIFIFLNNAI